MAMELGELLGGTGRGTFGAVGPATGRWRGGVRRYYHRDALRGTPACAELLLSRSQAFSSAPQTVRFHVSIYPQWCLLPTSRESKVPPACTCFCLAHLDQHPFTWS